MELTLMGAAEAAAAIRDGLCTSEELVSACLEKIEQLEEQVQAWAFIDPELALAQARAADLALQAGRSLGPLHGVPVGIKDIFDTRDMPTEDGTVLHSGRRPLEDATAIIRLREAGAVILGKTVTTELAVFSPGKTRNPHDLTRTPGRLIKRLCSRRGRGNGAAGNRYPDERVDDQAGLVLRRVWIQADIRTYLQAPGSSTVAAA